MSEETQGQNIVAEAKKAGVECFIWSTLPSSFEISGGKFMTRLYEGLSRRWSTGVVKVVADLLFSARREKCCRCDHQRRRASCLLCPYRQLLREHDTPQVRIL